MGIRTGNGYVNGRVNGNKHTQYIVLISLREKNGIER